MRNDRVKKFAVSAMLVAVSVILCIIASLFPTVSLAIVAISGIASAVTLCECGYKYATLAYFASASLSAILAPNKECAVYYILLFGYYPMIRTFFCRVKSRTAVVLLKTFFVSILFVILELVLFYLLGISEYANVPETAVGLILFNVAFWLYDICLGRVLSLYLSGRFKRGRFR